MPATETRMSIPLTVFIDSQTHSFISQLLAAARYSVKLNNLKQKRSVNYNVIEVSEGPRNQELWTVTVYVTSTTIENVETPFHFSGQGNSKGQAFNVASLSVLQELGIKL
ncbi:hypothetical protein FRB94_005428 [Tulasnella sp. JGI-2019a]|nr:hypothetical protein FRB94_005428 [Tulasnella sp. JGI-2019a]